MAVCGEPKMSLIQKASIIHDSDVNVTKPMKYQGWTGSSPKVNQTPKAMMYAPTKAITASGPKPTSAIDRALARPVMARPEKVRTTRKVEMQAIHMAMEKNIGARPRP